MPREALLAELRGLGPRKLRSLLACFSPAERDRLMSLVRPEEPAAAPSMPSFEALAGLSPWLLRCIDAGHPGTPTATRMTPAALAALAKALDAVAPATPGEQRVGAGRRNSLLARIGLERLVKARVR